MKHLNNVTVGKAQNGSSDPISAILDIVFGFVQSILSAIGKGQ